MQRTSLSNGIYRRLRKAIYFGSIPYIYITKDLKRLKLAFLLIYIKKCASMFVYCLQIQFLD